MGTSAARVEANRKNAQKSTGPKTAEGKSRSRGNALKHGMTGSGVVVPTADLATVNALEGELVVEFRPQTQVARVLVRRLAVMAVRLDRCVEQESAATAQRVRQAPMAYDDARQAEVEAQVGLLATDPANAVRRLCRTPEGVDWLIDSWTELHDEIRTGVAVAVAVADPPVPLDQRFGRLLGIRPGLFHHDELAAFCRVLTEAGASITTVTQARAREALLARIDEELAVLANLRAEVDDADEAANRAEAGTRALFDSSPEGERARRYEAAAQRTLFRTLRELREAPDTPSPAPSAPQPGPTPVWLPTPTPPRTGGPAPRPPAGPGAASVARPEVRSDAPRPLPAGKTNPTPGRGTAVVGAGGGVV